MPCVLSLLASVAAAVASLLVDARAASSLSMPAEDASADLVAVSALLDAAHATLSGRKYDALGRTGMADACYDRAAADAPSASRILGELTTARDDGDG